MIKPICINYFMETNEVMYNYGPIILQVNNKTIDTYAKFTNTRHITF